MDDVERLRVAGLYDPAAPDAAERLELLRFNLSQGLSVNDLVEAERRGRQTYVAGDPHIRPRGARITLAELADRAGVDVDKVRRFWRGAGLAEPGPDEAAAYDSDIEIADVLHTIEGIYGEQVTMQLLRVFGAAISRIAEAEVTTFATITGADLVEHGRAVELAQTNVGISRLIPRITTLFEVLHRHHLQATISTLFADPTTRESQTKHLAVGFADLVGYTAFTATSDARRVTALVEEFEAMARDTVTEHGGRVVKMIGDEVMFVANDVATGCRIGGALQGAASKLSALPEIRVGVACGDVLVGSGDYFGPVVNRASRLVSVAEPGTVLVDAEVRRHAIEGDSGCAFRDAGARLLKGFPEPVDTYEMVTRP